MPLNKYLDYNLIMKIQLSISLRPLIKEIYIQMPNMEITLANNSTALTIRRKATKQLGTMMETVGQNQAVEKPISYRNRQQIAQMITVMR